MLDKKHIVSCKILLTVFRFSVQPTPAWPHENPVKEYSPELYA
jgi:hypothetical protein